MKKLKDKDMMSYILIGYVFLIFCIYPLYVENGYYNMAIAKIRFLYTVSMITFLLLCIAWVLNLVLNKKKISILSHWKQISITEKLIYMYMVVIVISFLASPYKEKILWGAETWRMGTIPLLLMFGLAIFLMHHWREQKWVGYGLFLVSGMVFVLGICHRFSFYPIRIEPVQKTAFLSTLGNINWFCGYMSVISPIGIGMFLVKEHEDYKNVWQECLLMLYVLINFMIGFCQGSSSYFAWTAALFVVLLWIVVKDTNRIKRYLLLVSMWGMAGQITRVIHYLFLGSYNYYADTLNSTIDTNLTLVVMLAATLLNNRIKEGKSIPLKYQKMIRYGMVGTILLGGLLYIVISVYNTKVGIGALKDAWLFVWDENWGTGRGMIFKFSVELFEKMSPMQKIYGVGADGYSAFAYSFPEIADYFNENLGNSVLTNAHCELLTNMINLGVLGTALYVGVLFTFVVRCMKQGERYPMLYIPAICTICYVVNNLVSFAHVLNLPFLLIVIGIGEFYMRKGILHEI